MILRLSGYVHWLRAEQNSRWARSANGLRNLVFRAVHGWPILLTLLALLTLLPTPAGAETLELNRDYPQQIDPTIEYWLAEEIPEDIPGRQLANLAEKHGTVIKAMDANFGYRGKPVWFRLRLHNSGHHPVSRLAVVHAPQLDHITYYAVQRGKIIATAQTGEDFPWSHRLVDVPQYAFPFELEAGASLDLYFMVQSKGSLIFPLKIWEPTDFLVWEMKNGQLLLLVYGMLLISILFNVFIYLALKEIVYLFFNIFLTSSLLVQATLEGKTFQFLWPETPALQNQVILFLLPVAVISLSAFTRRFLNLDKVAPVMDRILWGFSLAGVLALISVLFLPAASAKLVAAMLSLAVALFLLGLGPLMWARGVRESRLFTVGWFFMLTGVSLYVGRQIGWLPHNFLTSQGVLLGSAGVAVMLSLAIVDRIYADRQTRMRTQADVIATQQKHQQSEMMRLYEALHVPVTELPNRAFLQRFVSDVERKDNSQPYYLVLVRLNRYQDLDRTLGQDTADQLIYQLAVKLNEHLDREAVFARLESGAEGPVYAGAVDESTLGLITLADEEERVMGAAREMGLFLQQRIRYGYLSIDLDPRIGIARYPADGESFSGLIRAAKIALDSTRQKNDFIRMFSQDINPYSERRLTLMAELEKAIDQGNLELWYQPFLNLRTRRITGMEALVRWNHPDFGPVSPAEFIPLAEQSGTISRLTWWVLREGMQKQKELFDAGYDDLLMSMNLSAVDLDISDLPEKLETLCGETAVASHALQLELTETAMMQNPIEARGILDAIRKAGFSIAMDDFGAGYSSLANLGELPLSKIKIDRYFIRSLAAAAQPRIIVEAIITMCQTLGYQVVAEGVEDASTARHLADMGCDELQGYWLAKPMPWTDFMDWLNTFASTHRNHGQQDLF